MDLAADKIQSYNFLLLYITYTILSLLFLISPFLLNNSFIYLYVLSKYQSCCNI